MTRLIKNGHDVFPVDRKLLYGEVSYLANFLSGKDAVINLAGAPILQRWSSRNKIVIYNSRVLTTRNLVEAINSLPPEKSPQVLVSSSAVGIYQTGTIVHNEDSQLFDNGFIGKVVTNWEDATTGLKPSVRLVLFRTGVVLGKNSQTIKKVLPVFKLAFGGRIGTGQQAFPFIHIDDLVLAYLESITNTDFVGIYNLVAPQQITNNDFTNTLSGLLKRPAIFHVMPFILKLFYGEASDLLIKGQFVNSKRLLGQGFQFEYPTINDCLIEILNKEEPVNS